MGVPVVPTDLEAPPSLQEDPEETAALTVGTATGVVATIDETLQHVESVGRPHDWWWALNNWRRHRVLAVFGSDICMRLEATLSNKYLLFFTMIMTLFCLYAVDVCDLAKGGTDARTAVSAILLAMFIFFSVDLLLSSIFVDKYILSFFFWVDLVGTASLILDIQWFVAGYLSAEGSNALQITRAGRAARIGSQMGRITRVLRMVRALRLLKVLQLRRRARQGMEHNHGLGNGPIRPTVLGELLAESTTRKCVIIILFVLIVATFLENYPVTAADYNRIQLVSYRIMTPEAFVQSSAHPVILLTYVDVLGGGRLVNFLPYTRTDMRSVMQLRTEVECAKYVGSRVEPCGFANDYNAVWYDVSKSQQLNAGLNIALTTVIIVCLGLSAYFFGRDATTYVIVPIETMLKYLKRMIMVGVDSCDVESENINIRKPPETDVLANYVSRLVNEIDNARWKAEEEARISDTLLNSMVPPRIARQLKELRWWEAGPEQRAQTIADSFPHTTVLFTDIVGFTTLSSRISPEDAMRHLNNMYTVFDEIVEKYGLYKVETIGDSYMLVGGAPEERVDHAERVAAAALEIRGCVPLLREISGEPGINVRIGMHSGAVTAGVVGFKNPRWHLFGDTCNTASRMESTGIAGEIQLSCTTYELIKDRFQCKVRGKIAVKGKGEMVTYLLERECGTSLPADSPSGLLAAGGVAAIAGLGAAAVGGSGGGGGGGGGDVMDREALLASPQFKKAMERYTAARNSLLAEEEEMCKLLKTLDDATTASPTAEELPLPPPSPSPSPPHPENSTGAEAAAGAVVPRLTVGLPAVAFKQTVLGGCTTSDLKALTLHMYEELSMSRAIMAAAEEEKAAGMRRDMLLKLYARVLEAPGMSLRDTFAAILEALYKIIECDVIKLYVVDHARGQLWPATRHCAADANRTLPLEGTLAGSAVRRARVVRVDDVSREEEFNWEMEELPAGYTSKSVMCVPVFSASSYHAPAQHALRLYNGAGTPPPNSSAPSAGAADVIAVLVMINRWTTWREAGAEEGERRIVPFAAADEASVRDAAASVGLLLMRRRGEMLLASAVSPNCLAGASFSVAALPASVARRRLRTVARRSSVALLDTRGNLWAMKQEELLGQARDVLLALQRRVAPSALSVLGAAGDEAMVSYLVRIADEQGAGRFFNLAHSVGVLQGIYLTLRAHTDLAAALGPHHLLALVLAASLLNIDRDGEFLPAVPTAGAPLSIGACAAVSGGAVSRTSRTRPTAGGSAGVAAAVGNLGLTPTPSSSALNASSPQTSLPPTLTPPPGRHQRQMQQAAQQVAEVHREPPLPVQLPPPLSTRDLAQATATAAGLRKSEPGIAAAATAVAAATTASVTAAATDSFTSWQRSAPPPPATSAFAVPVAVDPSVSSLRGWSGKSFPSEPPSPSLLPLPAAASAPACTAEMQAAVRPVERGDDAIQNASADASAPTPLVAVVADAADDGVRRFPPVVPADGTLSPPSGATGTAVPVLTSSGGGGATAAATTTAAAPSVTSASVARPRAVSARRGRLVAVVDEILSGESNILAAIPASEAAAVKASVVTLLALRNQPAAVLSMPGLVVQPDSIGGGGGGGGAAAAAASATAAAVKGVGGASFGLASPGAAAAAGAAANSVFDSATAAAAAVAALNSGEVRGGSSTVRGGSSTRPAVATAAAAMSPGGGGIGGPVGASSSTSAFAAAAAAGAGSQSVGPLSLSALIQAADTDPTRLAETRTAVCALLLLTWSELMHCKDPGTALSLLQGRAADVRAWASRLAASASVRHRSVSLLGPPDTSVEDVQNLLLLEVPRMQLEVIPLWQRTVELLPGLQPHLDALHANRATYVSMLQDTASLAATSSYAGGGGAAAGTFGGGAAAAASPRGSPGMAGAAAATAAAGGGSASNTPSSTSLRPSLRRSTAAMDGSPSSRDPRRFISVKQRGSSALARSVMALMPSGDSSTAAGGGIRGGPGSSGALVYIRASSSRSYGGRNGPDDFDGDVLEAGGGGGAAAAAAAAATGVGAATGGAPDSVSSGSRLLRQGGLPINSAAGSRSMRRVTSRSSGGPPSTVGASRLASLALQSSGSVASVAAAPAAAANGPDMDGYCTLGSGRHISGSNQPLLRVPGFRPRSQTHDLGTASAADSAAVAAAAAAAAASPVDLGGSGGSGQRRSSITNRLNTVFASFRASGRVTHRSLLVAVPDGGSGGNGGSSHANTVAMSPVAGEPSSPQQPQSLSLAASQGFEMYGPPDGGLHFACSPAAATASSAAMLNNNHGVGGGGGGAPVGPTLSQPLYGESAGWGESYLTSPAPFPQTSHLLLQSSQSPAVLSPASSMQRPAGLSMSVTAAAAAAHAGAVVASSWVLPAAAAGGLASPTSPSERAISASSKGRLRTTIMRRLSRVAAKLPFHAGGGGAAAAAAVAGVGGCRSSVDAGSWGTAPPAGEVAAVLQLDAAEPGIGFRPVSDSGTRGPQGVRLGSNGGRRGSGSGCNQVPNTAAAAAASLRRLGTIQGAELANHSHHYQQQQTSSQSPLTEEAGQGALPSRRRRVTAPSGALALAQQHEECAATVAAAAIAFAARQAAAAAAAAAAGCGNAPLDVDQEPAVPLIDTDAILPSTVNGLVNVLPTVAELTGSGRHSSGAGTARSNSIIAPGETPKHAATAAAATATTVHTAGPCTLSRSGADAGLGSSRLSQTPSYNSSHGKVAPAAAAAAAPLPPSPPALMAPGFATAHPPRTAAHMEMYDGGATAPSVAIITVAASTQGRDGEFAEYGEPANTTPGRRASSKGVWLGLRLASDAIRSFGRRHEGGGGGGGSGRGRGYSTSSSGVLQSGLAAIDSETPRLSSTVAPSATTRHRSGVCLASPPTAATSASSSRNPSRLQTPAASLRRGGAAIPVGVGGVASLQAAIDMAEAALAAGGGGAPYSPLQYGPSRMEQQHRVSYCGMGGPTATPSRNQSQRRSSALSAGQAGAIDGSAGAATGGPAPVWLVDEAMNQRTSAPPAPSRFSLRRTGASRTFADQATAISAAPSLQPPDPLQPERHS